MQTAGLLTFIAVTLNIWGLPRIGHLTPAPLRDVRVQHICTVLKENTSWDVVLLQEVWVKSDRETLKQCGYPYAVDVEDNRRLIDSGLLLLSRHPIAESHRLTFPPLPETQESLETGEQLSRKSAVVSKLVLPGDKAVWVGNTHLVARYDVVNDTFLDARRSQFHDFVSHATGYAENEPLVLGGDWNFGPPDALWKEALELLPGFSEAPESKNACTICPPNFMHDRDEGKVDHLFGNPRVTSRGGALAFDAEISSGAAKLNVSDHFGWETSFQIE